MAPQQEKINQWKAQYKRVYKITVIGKEKEEVDGIIIPEEEYTAYFKEPDFTMLRAVKNEASEGDELKASEMLYKACVLYADPEIEEITSLKISVFKEMQSIIALKKTKFHTL